jgi:hypothetical protein
MKIVFFMCLVEMIVGFILPITKVEIGHSKSFIAKLTRVYWSKVSKDEIKLFIAQKSYLKLFTRI